MSKRQFKAIRLSLYPKPVVVVTSINNQGAVAGTTIAWNGILSSRPPVLAVSFLPDSFARSCIVESREFVVNIPDGRFWREANYLGSLSGDWIAKMEKAPADLAKLTLGPSSTIRSPRINEFYLNFECRMLHAIQIGLYDCILGEVLTMHCDDAVFIGDHPKGNIDHMSVQALCCFGDQYWSGGAPLGKSTENKEHPHGREH